jgi:hypothetical protein
MLVSLVCCVTAAGGRYLLQGVRADSTAGRATFVIAVLVLPMLLLIAVNAVRLAVAGLRGPRRRRP